MPSKYLCLIFDPTQCNYNFIILLQATAIKSALSVSVANFRNPCKHPRNEVMIFVNDKNPKKTQITAFATIGYDKSGKSISGFRKRSIELRSMKLIITCC